MSDNASDNATIPDTIIDDANIPEQAQEVIPEQAQEAIPKVQILTNEYGDLTGYACQSTLAQNEVTDIDLVFYMDFAYPPGQSLEALQHLQTGLVEAVALEYGISTGAMCESPPFNGNSWLVQFFSDFTDYSVVQVFDSCRELNSTDPSQGCNVYEAVVTGSILGGSQMGDVMEYIEALVRGTALTENSAFSVAFLGVPVEGSVTEEENGNSVGGPSSIQEGEGLTDPGQERKTVTIVGGLLVAAFCCAFIGIILVLWRRRQQYLNDTHLLKSPSRDLQQYDTEPHISDDPDAHPSMDSSPESKEKEVFPNNITFDLGTSFKDQLMGVHGHNQGGPSRRPLGHGTMMMSDPYGRQMPTHSDASDSDADSWAQTDGTIGSLENLHLEPITAEV
jgi:hypothetical protein